MKFRLDEAKEFGWEGVKGWSYNTEQEFVGASGTYIEVIGRHGMAKSTVNDLIYYVIDGEGEFEVGENRFAVEASDVVIIPKQTAFDYWAINNSVLRLSLVCVPAFDPSGSVSLEE
jgi:mannose-6-phosphate isomerase-like protein (cupin superfamily)